MIRLTLILTAGIVGSMLIFGDDQGHAARDTIAETVLVPAKATDPVIAAEPDTATAPDSKATDLPAVAKRAPTSSGLTAVQHAGLLVFEARDAPRGFVAAKQADTETPAPMSAPTPVTENLHYVTGNRVNLRSGPSTGDGVVAQLLRGARAELLAEAGDGWVQIRDIESGNSGFMAARFLAPVSPG